MKQEPAPRRQPHDGGQGGIPALQGREDVKLGPQELAETEQDFKLAWWPRASAEGRFLLPGGPLALLLADRLLGAGNGKTAAAHGGCDGVRDDATSI